MCGIIPPLLNERKPKMKILDMPCTKGFMQLAQDGVDKGWHEMNGGNLS